MTKNQQFSAIVCAVGSAVTLLLAGIFNSNTNNTIYDPVSVPITDCNFIEESISPSDAGSGKAPSRRLPATFEPNDFCGEIREDGSLDTAFRITEMGETENGEFEAVEVLVTVIAPIEYEVTAYCHCAKCCGKSDRITASGYRLRDGDLCIAADLPFGTILSVPGYGVATVLDRGGAIKGKRLDVYFSSHDAALNWGRKILQVREIK